MIVNNISPMLVEEVIKVNLYCNEDEINEFENILAKCLMLNDYSLIIDFFKKVFHNSQKNNV